MGQTTEILPKTKKIYKKLFQNKILDKIFHKIMNIFVNIWAKIVGFNFPKKFNWDWKIEMLSQKYEKDTTDLFKKIVKPDMVIIDIGGHIGYYTTLFAKLSNNEGKIYAFEADSDNFKLLRKNTAKYQNITLINKAVSNHSGEVSFFKIKNSTGCHSVIASQNAEKITVPAIAIDDFLEQNNINQVDLIKIDIEGGEPLAFQGMKKLFSKNQNLSVIMEFSPESLKSANINPLKFLQEIKNYGFEILQIFPNAQTKPLQISSVKDLDWYRTGYANLLLKK